MPEFILNTAGGPGSYGYNAAKKKPHPFYDLDDFTRGYVEAMFFTNGDTGDEREDILNKMGVDRLTKASVKTIAEQCAAFQKSTAPLLALAYSTGEYDAAQAGRDFWFTRQGHGVGFWDRKQLKRDVYKHADNSFHFEPDAFDAKCADNLGYKLSNAAEACGETHVWIWRGWIHVQ